MNSIAEIAVQLATLPAWTKHPPYLSRLSQEKCVFVHIA